MIRPFSICLLACCEIVLAASQPPQKTSMEGSRANRSKVTIEGLVRDMACPIQNLDGNANSLSLKCARACVRDGSPIAILTRDGDLYVRVSGTAFERNGTHAIVIAEIREMKEVHVTIDEE